MPWLKISELVTDPGFGRHDRDTVERLAASLRRFGQVRPVLVANDGDGFRVVDGRCVVEALKLNGKDEVKVEHLGEMSPADQAKLNLALRVRAPLAHVAVARTLTDHLEAGRLTADEVAAMTEFTVHQVKGLPGLVRFDAARFSQETGQAELGDYVEAAAEEMAEEAQPPQAQEPPEPTAQGDGDGGGLPF